jgi:hypothetical protein
MVWVGMSRGRFVGGRNVKAPAFHPRTIEAQPGAMENHPGAMETHSGGIEAALVTKEAHNSR